MIEIYFKGLVLFSLSDYCLFVSLFYGGRNLWLTWKRNFATRWNFSVANDKLISEGCSMSVSKCNSESLLYEFSATEVIKLYMSCGIWEHKTKMPEA